jgi:hypothetical protein
MNQGKLVFSQLMAFLPLSTFRRCVATHRGDYKVQDFTCMDQFLTMAFAQLTRRESLCDIEVNLRAQAKRMYHMHLPNSLHEILQILSLTMFETISINQLLTATVPDKHPEFESQKLYLF